MLHFTLTYLCTCSWTFSLAPCTRTYYMYISVFLYVRLTMYIRNVHRKYNIFNIINFKHFILQYLCTLYVFFNHVQYKLHFYTSFIHFNSRHHFYTTVSVHILRVHLHTTFSSILYVRLTMYIQNYVEILPDNA